MYITWAGVGSLQLLNFINFSYNLSIMQRENIVLEDSGRVLGSLKQKQVDCDKMAALSSATSEWLSEWVENEGFSSAFVCKVIMMRRICMYYWSGSPGGGGSGGGNEEIRLMRRE